jgi:hypothetical protein
MAKHAWFHGKRVSPSHKIVLDELERRGILSRINQGRRTIPEQTVFWLARKRYEAGLGPWAPVAARPWGGAPHIKWGREHHALDIDDGIVDRVALAYSELGIAVAFNVSGEPWHMDVLDEAALIRAARGLDKAGHITATLKFGMRHNDVKYAQSLLRKIDKKGEPRWKRKPGKTYGVTMRNAVKQFQKDNGLNADGVIGRNTWRMLIRRANQ